MRSFLLRLLQWKLRFLAKMTLKKYKPVIVGVTGNVGKTSTKDAVRTVLNASRFTRGSEKNFNNELGLPLVILGDWPDTEGLFFWPLVIIFSLRQLIFHNRLYPEMIVLEYGVDRPNDMDYLLQIVRPSVAVVTAIGEIPVHIEFFAGKEELAREKSKLITGLPTTGFAVLNVDDETVLNMRSQTRAHAITFGFDEKADLRITNFEEFFESGNGSSFGQAGVSFKLNYGGSFVPVKLNGVFGRSQAYAAAAAALVGLTFGMNLVKISEALQGYLPPPGRMRLIQGEKNTAIIDDTYNASLLAMESALATLERLPAKRKIAVLGDMLEVGKYTAEAHEIIGRQAAKVADILITVGMRARFIADAAEKRGMKKSNIFSFDKVGEAGYALEQKMRPGDLILVKGSQGVRMEKIVKEVMAEPGRAGELLTRQTSVWLKKKGLYD